MKSILPVVQCVILVVDLVALIERVEEVVAVVDVATPHRGGLDLGAGTRVLRQHIVGKLWCHL